MLERFFGGEARTRIEASVRLAEERSLGQIVPVVVDKSDGYHEVRYRGAAIAALAATGVALATHAPLGAAELPLVQIGAALLGALLSLVDPVERLLAGPRMLDEAVRIRALRAFHEEGLHRTRDGTGVLVFASLFERRAVVLGDHGVHARMGEQEWQRAVQVLVEGMGRGDPAGGFCSAIEICGARLAEHFPRTAAAPGPSNELTDELRARPH